MKFILCAFAATAFLLVGCATMPTLSLPGRAQSPDIAQEGEILQSGTQHSVRVQLKPQTVSDDLLTWPVITIEITNDSEQPLDVSDNCFAAFSGQTQVPVLLPAEYEILAQPERRKHDALARAAAFSQASASIESGSTRRATMGGPYMDRGFAAAMALNCSIDRAGASQPAGATVPMDWAFQPDPGSKTPAPAQNNNLLAPKGRVSGFLHFDGRAIRVNQPLRLVVTLNGESHEFVFEVKPTWKSYK